MKWRRLNGPIFWDWLKTSVILAMNPTLEPVWLNSYTVNRVAF